jgi:FkbM family methyltransferase
MFARFLTLTNQVVQFSYNASGNHHMNESNSSTTPSTLLNEMYSFAEKKQYHSVNWGNDEVLTKIWTGHKIFISNKDYSLSPHLALEGLWETELTLIFEKITKQFQINTFVDIGANFGYFTLIMNRFVPKLRSFCFEPNPKVYNKLKHTIDINGLTNRVSCDLLAISDKEGKDKLYEFDDLWGSNSIFKNDLATNSFDIETQSFDYYLSSRSIKEKIDLIKIDVEGAEHLVWRGMQSTISANPNLIIIMEYSLNAYNLNFFSEMKSKFKYVYILSFATADFLELNTNPENSKYSSENLVMLVLTNREISK